MPRQTLRLRALALPTALLAALALTITLAPGPAIAQSAPAPRLAYGTFLGGAGDDDARAVAVDGAGNIYLAGTTYSEPFPGTSGQRRDTNAFVTKLDPTGKSVVYSVLIGGSDDEEGLALAVDAAGNAWVAGYTQSADLPLRRPLPFSFQGDDDSFVSMLDPQGRLLFQSYLGYQGPDRIGALALDAAGNAYLGGEMGATYGPQVRAAKLSA
ncbi:MAG TPA: SBBP repeat-containing protein, partial [Chloroflexaceae bacterium]|nr:SBBP repeat-containing protein [Chloroflexaceae bacterium]